MFLSIENCTLKYWLALWTPPSTTSTMTISEKHFPLVGLDLVDGVDVYELDLELDISIYLEKLDGYEAYLYLFFFFIF